MQQAPNPFAQGPLGVPPLCAHSEAAKQVPLSPVAPWQAWLLNCTRVNKDRTETEEELRHYGFKLNTFFKNRKMNTNITV